MRKISYDGDLKNTAQAVGINLQISRKIGREIAVFIKGKNVDLAISELEKVSEGKLAIPYKRHNRDTPHRKGKIMSGRFPRNSSLEIIKLLKNLKSNAETKGLSEDDLVIIHAACQHASIAWHYGRKRGRRRKLAHFELVCREVEKKGKIAPIKKEEQVKKAEVKKSEKKIKTSEIKSKSTKPKLERKK